MTENTIHKITMFNYSLAGVFMLIGCGMMIYKSNLQMRALEADSCYYEIKSTGVISPDCQELIDNIKKSRK